MTIVITKDDILNYHELNFTTSSHIYDVVQRNRHLIFSESNLKESQEEALNINHNKQKQKIGLPETNGTRKDDKVSSICEHEIVLDNLENDALELEHRLIGEKEMRNNPDIQAFMNDQEKHKRRFEEDIESKGFALKKRPDIREEIRTSLNY